MLTFQAFEITLTEETKKSDTTVISRWQKQDTVRSVLQPPRCCPPGYPLGSTVLYETEHTPLCLLGPTERTVNRLTPRAIFWMHLKVWNYFFPASSPSPPPSLSYRKMSQCFALYEYWFSLLRDSHRVLCQCAGNTILTSLNIMQI
jgi:hypothetical protein